MLGLFLRYYLDKYFGIIALICLYLIYRIYHCFHHETQLITNKRAVRKSSEVKLRSNGVQYRETDKTIMTKRIKWTKKGKLTENTQGQTPLVHQIAAARQSDVDGSTRHGQAVVQVRGGEVHDRGHSFRLCGFLCATDDGRPRHGGR